MIGERTRARIMRYFGAAGVAWLEELPALIERYRRKWDLDVGPVHDTGAQVSWTAPVARRDGSRAVLKIALPHPEATHQAVALRTFDGRGAVRLLDASDDGWAMLLERCEPGDSLWSVGVDEGNDVMASLLERTWATDAAGPFERLPDRARRWSSAFTTDGGYDAGLVHLAAELVDELASDDDVLLHGDLQPGNVLAAQREPWLAIDPLPLVGERAFDLAQILANRTWSMRGIDDPVRELRRQMDRLCARLDLDHHRVAGWAIVKAHAWTQGPDTVRVIAQAGGFA